MILLVAAALSAGAAQVVTGGAPQVPQSVPNGSPAATASIRGHVLRPDGRPVPHAQMHLLLDAARAAGVTRVVEFNRAGVGSGGLPAPVETDIDGVYEFTEVPPGRYRVSASKPGFVTVEFGQPRASEPGRFITVSEGETVERIDLVLPRPGAIGGHIVDEAGDPVEGASVRAMQIEYVAGRRQLVPAPAASPTRTNDVGRFRVYGLQPGRYVVCAVVGQVAFPEAPMAELPGYAPTFYPGTPNASEAQLLTIDLSTDLANIDFPLATVQTARITGTILDAEGAPTGSPGGFHLLPTRRSGAVLTTAVGAHLNSSGRFEFRNVPPGEYVIQSYRGGRGPGSEGEFAARIVSVNGSDVTGLVIQMMPGSSITGRVRLEGSGAITTGGVDLSMSPADPDLAPGGPFASAAIHDDWTFELNGISGVRRFHVGRLPKGWALKAILLQGSDITDGVLQFGTNDQSLRDVEVVLTQQVSEVSGTIADSAGHPMAGATVIVFATERQRWYPDSRFMRTAVTGPDGAFSVRGLPPDEYYVAAIDKVAGAEWQDPGLLEAVAANASRITLLEGQTLAINPRPIVRSTLSR